MTPSGEAASLARKLAALPEPTMRELVLREYLEQADPDVAVWILYELLLFGRRGQIPFNSALRTLASLLGKDRLAYEVRLRLYASAKEADLSALTALFFSSTNTLEEEAPREGVRLELTLGHRKWLARSSRRETLERLLRSPEPDVVAILLQNPKLLERDVVMLAARRPTCAEIQWRIFSSARWIARYPVKKTLVLNPYTPSELSLRLLGFLNAQDLKLILTSPMLPENLRQAAARFAAPLLEQ